MVEWQVFYQDVERARQVLQEEHIFTRIINNWEVYNYLLTVIIFFGLLFLWFGFRERKRLLKENTTKDYEKGLFAMGAVVLMCIYFNYQPINYSEAYLVILQECKMIVATDSKHTLQGHLYKKETITSTPISSVYGKKSTDITKYQLPPKIANVAQQFSVQLIVVGNTPIGILHTNGTYYLDY